MKYKPTDAELEVMQVLWERGASTVRTVHEELTKNRQVVYTTTLKLMQVMTEKGLLERTTDKVSHVYKCAMPKQEVQNDLVESFLSRVFKGSAMSLMMNVLGKTQPTAEELDEIKQVIEQLEKERNKSNPKG